MAFDLDRHADEADLLRLGLRSQPSRSVEEIGLVAQIGHDSRSTCRNDIPGDAFADRVLAPFDLLAGQPDCRLGAQSAGRFVEQYEGAAAHRELVGNDLHHFPERISELEGGGKDPANFG
jgi:hypothetical protein